MFFQFALPVAVTENLLKSSCVRVLSLVSFLLLAAIPALAEDQGWVLTQRSARLGDQYLYVSQYGVKLVNPKLSMVIICRAPSYELFICNDQTRNYYQTTAEAWQHECAARQGTTDFSSTSGWKPTGALNIAGLPTTVYSLDGSWVKRKINGSNKVSDSSGASYALAQGIHVPAKLCELLSVAYGVPAINGVPLRLAFKENGGTRSVLDTYRCDRASLPAAYFDKPNGYHKVASDAEVMMSSDQNKMIQDMAQSLGPSSSGNDKILQQAVQKYGKGGGGPSADEIKAAIEAYKRQMGH